MLTFFHVFNIINPIVQTEVKQNLCIFAPANDDDDDELYSVFKGSKLFTYFRWDPSSYFHCSLMSPHKILFLEDKNLNPED